MRRWAAPGRRSSAPSPRRAVAASSARVATCGPPAPPTPATAPASGSGSLSRDVDPAGARRPAPPRCRAASPTSPPTTRSAPERGAPVADRDPKILARKAELTSTDHLTASVKAEAVHVWEVGYYLDGEKVNLVIVDGETGEAKESWTGSAVDWPMARGKPGPVRPHPQRALRLDPAGARSSCSASGTSAAGASGSTSTCSSCSASGSARRSSTRPRSASRSRSTTRRSSTCWSACSGSASAAHGRDGGGRGGAAPEHAGLADDGRGDRPDRPAPRRQPRRLGGHRRRLRGRDRRRQDHRRRADLRRAPSPTTTRPATPTGPPTTSPTSRSRRSLPWSGVLGRPARRPRGDDLLRPATVAGLFALGLGRWSARGRGDEADDDDEGGRDRGRAADDGRLAGLRRRLAPGSPTGAATSSA